MKRKVTIRMSRRDAEETLYLLKQVSDLFSNDDLEIVFQDDGIYEKSSSEQSVVNIKKFVANTKNENDANPFDSHLREYKKFLSKPFLIPQREIDANIFLRAMNNLEKPTQSSDD